MKLKHYILLLIAGLAILPCHAFSYSKAQQQAWFLTDKMAYELNLTEEQYDKAYEINLDYFLRINTPSDVYGFWWDCRNTDFRYILFDWQYTQFLNTIYFYRPLQWLNAAWHWRCYDHYRHGHYFFRRPPVVITYRGRHHTIPSRVYHSPYKHFTARHKIGLRDRHFPLKKPDTRPSHLQNGTLHMRSDGKLEWNKQPVPGKIPSNRPTRTPKKGAIEKKRSTRTVRPSRNEPKGETQKIIKPRWSRDENHVRKSHPNRSTIDRSHNQQRQRPTSR